MSLKFPKNAYWFTMATVNSTYVYLNIPQRFYTNSNYPNYLWKNSLVFPLLICNIFFKTDFIFYDVYHMHRECTQIPKIDDSNSTCAILNRCYSNISSNKDLGLCQAVSSKADDGGWAAARKPHSSRSLSQERLTTSELAGETQHQILLQIIILLGRPWLLGNNRKLINLLHRNNIVGGSFWTKNKKRSPSRAGFIGKCVMDWKDNSEMVLRN